MLFLKRLHNRLFGRKDQVAPSSIAVLAIAVPSPFTLSALKLPDFTSRQVLQKRVTWLIMPLLELKPWV